MKGKIVSIIFILILILINLPNSLGNNPAQKILAKDYIDSETSNSYVYKAPINNPLNNEIESFLITLKSRPYELITTNGITEISMDEFGSILIPSCPKLPAKTYCIGIPPGGKIVSIELISEKHEIINGCYNILQATPLTDGINSIDYEVSDEIYSPSDFYPSYVYQNSGMEQLRKYSFAQINFFPVSYLQNLGKLKIYSEITLKIAYKIEKTLPNELLADNVMDDYAADIIFNYPSIYQYYKPPFLHQSSNISNYIIITKSSLENSLNFFKNWKEYVGHSVRIVNISWVSSQYSGIDLEEKIRNFLIDKYALWGIEYVLIVGNHSTIPMRNCYPNKDNHNENWKTPTDYYYADLTGDWDSDGDGFFGERGDDSPDFYAEVMVGRIPVNTPSIVEDICNKTIKYERDNGQWKNKILSCGPFICFENEDYTGWLRTDHATVLEKIWYNIYFPNNYSRTTMYEKAGLDPSNYMCDFNLSHENVSMYWPDGYGIVNLDGHGNPLAVYRKWWGFDDGDGVPEAHEIYWEAYMSSYDNISLNNNKPSIVFSVGCKTIFPDYQYNLGKSLLINGSVAYIGATGSTWLRAGWKNENWGGCQSIEYYFFNFIINESQTCAEALYNSKLHYKNNFDFGGWAIFQNLYDFCLYGDPALSLTTYENNPPDRPAKPTGPLSGEIGVDYTYSTSTIDPELDKVYFWFDWGDGKNSSWVGPYYSGQSGNATHAWNTKGSYDIKVKAKDVYGAESDWETLTVTISRDKSINKLILRFLQNYQSIF